ncbi:hypothetical protein V8O11_24850, partial [Erwinia aphidicola]|uniref:hypothetical protein n=1 Tax=Erwinia aphidicola TaxID=68334 RepID=UPI00300C8C4A
PTMECERAERKNGVGATAFSGRPVFAIPGRSKKMIDPYNGMRACRAKKWRRGRPLFLVARVFKSGSIEKEDRPLQWNASVPGEKMA